MRFEVVGRGIEITDAIREHAEEKSKKLTRYYDGVQQINITITREDHGNHAQFDVELILDVVNHDDFVCHGKGDDLYLAIDQAVQKGTRVITDFKDKLRDRKESHTR
jgi:putative sigma-54 modulation protein